MKSTIFKISMIACFVCISSAYCDKEEMYKLTKQAYLLPSNRIKEKIELYSQAIDAYPEYYLPWVNRAVCYLNYGVWDLAIEDANTAIRLSPNHPHGWGVRGRAYAGKREFEAAFSDLSQALELTSTDEEKRNLHNDRGNAYFSARDYESAIKDYEQAVQISETFAKGWNNLGIAYRSKADFDNGFVNLDKAHRLDRKSARILVNRARIYVARRDQTMALQDYNDAVDLDPNDASVFVERGMFHFLNNDKEYARADFAKAIELQDANPYAAIYSYITESSLGFQADARVRLQKYLVDRTDTDFWPMPIVKFFLGQMTPKQVLEQAELVGANKEIDEDTKIDAEPRRKEQKAEAYFFLALHFNIQQDPQYKDYLLRCVEQEVPRVQEYVMAEILLDGWEDPVPPPPRPVPNPKKIKF